MWTKLESLNTPRAVSRSSARRIIACSALSFLLAAHALTSNGNEPTVKVTDESFKCIMEMTKVRHFYVDNLLGRPLEVEVRDSLEKAMKILKQKMSKEGILQELKRRRFYEKPSVKRKRKTREARKRLRREMKRRVMPAPPTR